MKIAVIGTGIAGNVAAYHLQRAHEITVFEAKAYAGGHTNTIDVDDGGRNVAVDTGFIVFNRRNYPEFNGLLDELGVASHPSEMSFSVSHPHDLIEYNGSNLNGLFAQRRNLLQPRFHRLIADILRFNRIAPAALAGGELTGSVFEYLDRQRFGTAFADHYLLPMAAAIWSSTPASVRDMPVEFLVRFFLNHGLVQLRNRPQWRVITGGSREYVRRLTGAYRDRIRLRCPVQWVRRLADGVLVKARGQEPERYDCVFIATHSDQALALLRDATPIEQTVLGAMRYGRNTATLHTDTRMLPRRPAARASWNYRLAADPAAPATVTYDMNRLQGLGCDTRFCVTLNDRGDVARGKVLRRIEYEHPVFSRESVAAQQRQAELNNSRTFFCGAYWRNGFHEDGVISALAALKHFRRASEHEQLYLRRAG